MKRTQRVTRRDFLKTASSATIAMATLGVDSARAADEQRPNIVFVYTDDHGPWALGLENPQVHTPNMDRLFAEQGAQLVNAFVVTPVCSPARGTVLTGRYATELGIHDWVHPDEDDVGLDADAVTWPSLLSEAGYATGLFGKWHLGRADRFHPTRFGFDEFTGFLDHGPPSDPVLEKDGREQAFEGLTIDILTEHTIDFIERHRAGPFMAMLSTRSPHRSWQAVEEDRAPYEGVDLEIPDYPGLDAERVRRYTRDYLASVTSIDRNLGRILERLDVLDLTSNTVVVFTANEGNALGHNGFWGKGNAVSMLTDPPPGTENIPGDRRPNLMDVVLRVPTAIRWPGVIEPGILIEETVTNLDWFPTLLAMAGVEPPADGVCRGRDFLPLLTGAAVSEWDNNLYAEYSPHHGIQAHMRAWRTPQWKLVRDFLNPWRDEFYDLVNDPEEHENLIHDGRFRIRMAKRALHERIVSKMQELNDPAVHLATSGASLAVEP